MILLYHDISHDMAISRNLHTVLFESFCKQVISLKNTHSIVSVDEWFSLKNHRKLACITFDDAYKSIFKQAIPFLIAEGIPATVFINGGTMTGHLFWRDKIRDIIMLGQTSQALSFLSRNGIPIRDFYRETKRAEVSSKHVVKCIDQFIDDIPLLKDRMVERLIAKREELITHPLISYGNHTYNHYVLSSLSKEEQYSEITLGKQYLDSLPVNKSNVFSIPFGGLKDINIDTIDIVKSMGHMGMLFSRNRINMNKKLLLSCMPTAERYMLINEDVISKKLRSKLDFKTLVYQQMDALQSDKAE